MSAVAGVTDRVLPSDVSTRRGGALQTAGARLFGLLGAACLLALVTIVSLLVGNYPLHLSDVLGGWSGDPTSDAERVVRYARVPRTATGLLAGCALGVAGCLMQGLTRNPLAGPGILGINAGAALAVVVAIGMLGITSTTGYLWFAFAGAALAAVFVYGLGSLGLGGATPVRLALAGAAFTAFVGAITSMLTLLDASTLDDYRFWVVGSLTRADLSSLFAVTPFLTLGVVIAAGVGRSLNVLALGEDVARTLGSRLWVVGLLGAGAVMLLAGGATAIAGPVGFVGLVVPHVARAITGPDYRWVIAWTLVLAPLLVLAADILGRVVVRPEQLQVGIVTALLGTPGFLYLVRHRKVAGL